MTSYLFYFVFLGVATIDAFNPSYTTKLTSAKGATHEAITRCGLATVTGEYITSRFGISITMPTVSNGTCPPSLFSQIQAAFPNITAAGGGTYSAWKNTMDEIVNHNELVDLFEQIDASRHFDSESFVPASDIVRQRYLLAVDALNATDYDQSNTYFGQMTHTLQDFYSHSNWIELNNRDPQPDLGIRVMNSTQFAAPTVRTCTSCATGANAVCQSNNDVSKGLTSGYFSLIVDILNKKPTGKCSHGGALDATKDNDAIGGINKDALDSIHGYLHESAAQTAYLATCKIIRQLRTDVQDAAFGKFLNVLNRRKAYRRSVLLNALVNRNLDPLLPYTNMLASLRQANSFSVVQQLVSVAALDAFYRAHVLYLAKRKQITIDIFRNSILSSNLLDFGQDLARSTGGLYVYNYKNSQLAVTEDTDERPELLDFVYSKTRSALNRTIFVDATCSNLVLDLITNDSMPSFTLQLKRSNRSISPSSMQTDTAFYKSYVFTNLTADNWTVVVSSSATFTYDLRITCASQFRCFSRLYVDNDNPVHAGQVELQGNVIQTKTVRLLTTCDNDHVAMKNMAVTMVDETDGTALGNPFQSTYDASNDRWVTSLTNIPSKRFRLKFSINDRQIQRLSWLLYEPSLIDVEIYQTQTTATNTTLVKYRVFNYQKQSIKIKCTAKNIGTFVQFKEYTLKANETRDDQLEFSRKARQNTTIGDMLALTVTSDSDGWNYDIFSL